MNNSVGWVVVAGALLGVTACTTPDLPSPDVAQCKGGPEISDDAKLIGCTAIIEAEGQADEARSDAYFNRAKLFFAKNDYDRAIADFDQTIRLEPKAFGALTLRGMAYASKGDYDRAIADYTKALQLYPGLGMATGGLTEAQEAKARLASGQKRGDPRAWCDGKAFVDEGFAQDLQISGCTTLIQSGRETRDALADDYYKRAKAYDFSGSDRDKAIADYSQAIKLKPNLAEVYFGRGTLYFLAAQHDQAIADFDHAIRLKPSNALYFSYRGQARYKKGQWAAAISDFDRALKLQPKSAETFVDRARAFIGKGEYRRAIADCDHAIKLSPVNSVTASYNTRGDAYFHLGDWRNAIDDYDRAVKLWPEYPIALYGRGAAKTHIGNVADGQSDMQAAQKLQADVATVEAKIGIVPAK